MRILGIDIETYSSVDLSKCGVYKYCESSDFTILILGYAFDDEPVIAVDLTKNTFPIAVKEALQNPEIIKTAFNAQFERTALASYLKQYQPPEQWQCTAVLSRELGLPGSLEAAGAGYRFSRKRAKI